uniref:Uncharacterized protein n=1 Tax=Chelonoidis abingdonii TaxID=106734 RepID=A0A8C0GNP6_CHEAB
KLPISSLCISLPKLLFARAFTRRAQAWFLQRKEKTEPEPFSLFPFFPSSPPCSVVKGKKEVRWVAPFCLPELLQRFEIDAMIFRRSTRDPSIPLAACQNSLRSPFSHDCSLSPAAGEKISFKYSPGKLRGNQYKTMMTKEELEEEQRAIVTKDLSEVKEVYTLITASQT